MLNPIVALVGYILGFSIMAFCLGIPIYRAFLLWKLPEFASMMLGRVIITLVTSTLTSLVVIGDRTSGQELLGLSYVFIVDLMLIWYLCMDAGNYRDLVPGKMIETGKVKGWKISWRKAEYFEGSIDDVKVGWLSLSIFYPDLITETLYFRDKWDRGYITTIAISSSQITTPQAFASSARIAIGLITEQIQNTVDNSDWAQPVVCMLKDVRQGILNIEIKPLRYRCFGEQTEAEIKILS